MRIKSVYIYAFNGINQHSSSHYSALITLNTGTLAQGVYINVVHLENEAL